MNTDENPSAENYRVDRFVLDSDCVNANALPAPSEILMRVNGFIEGRPLSLVEILDHINDLLDGVWDVSRVRALADEEIAAWNEILENAKKR